VIVTKSKTVLSDNIAGVGLECIAKNQNIAGVFGFSNTLDHEFDLISDNRLELGDAPLGEHGIERCSANDMEVTFGSRESHSIGAESSRHPLILVISRFRGVQFIEVGTTFHMKLPWSDADNWAW
jgi:hypothetical protein